jgi:hypothetical protein
VTPAELRRAEQRFVEWCAGERIQIDWRDTLPPGVAGWSSWKKRTVAIPRFRSEEDVETAWHEGAHHVVGVCPGRPPHHPDPKSTRWHRCMACELLAAEEAFRLMRRHGVRLTRRMHASEAASLRSYRRSTPNTREQRQAVDRLTSDSNFARLQLAQLEHELRLNQWEEIKQIATEPRILTAAEKRREQLAELRRWWAREIKNSD